MPILPSSGTAEAAVSACKNEPLATADGLSGPGPVDAPTVGKRAAGLIAETLVPAIGGSVLGTGSVTSGLVGLLVGLSTTTSVAVPMYPDAPEADASALSCTSSPNVALDWTGTVASSSSAWPIGRLPTLQIAPLTAGQTVKVGVPTDGAAATLAVTETPVAAALVVQTHITKLARPPAWTCDDVPRDVTRTHNCGVA